MKKLVFIILGIIILSVGYLLVSGEKPMEENAVQNQSNQITQERSDNQSGGKYVDYSEAAVAEASGTRLLFFHAPWCPQCRALEKSIKESTLPGDLTIFKVDYDTNQALRQKYGVTIQTTVVKIDEKGNLVEKYVAYDDPTYQNVANNLL